MSRHAFVSYSRTDSAYVEQLIAWFTENGVPIWSDAGIVYGSQWPAVVRDAVDRSAAVVVVMTPAAESSEWVDRELARAELKRRPVLPLLLAGDPFFRLGSTQYEDVRGGHLPRDAFVRRILDLCHSDVPAPPERPALPILIHDGTRSVHERVEPLATHLAALLRSLLARSEDAFLILERPGEPDDYAQAVVDEAGSFQVEHRDGGPDHHYAAITDDADVAAHVLAGWVDRIDGWDSQLQWEQLRFS
jgi:TIR domain